MTKDVILTTKAPIYGDDMPLVMRIDKLENDLKLTLPDLSWDERLVKARLLMKGEK